MSIRNKILLGVVVSIIGILAICGMVYYTITQLEAMDHDIQQINQATKLSDDVLSSMLSARLNEMQFIAEKDMLYVEEVKKQIGALQNQTKEVKQITNNLIVNTKADQLITSSNQYLSQFNKLVGHAEEIGLNNSLALTGVMQHSASYFQILVRNAKETDVLSQMYYLRMIEKDFLIRPIPKSVEIFENQAGNLKQTVTESTELSFAQKETLSLNLKTYVRKSVV